MNKILLQISVVVAVGIVICICIGRLFSYGNVKSSEAFLILPIFACCCVFAVFVLQRATRGLCLVFTIVNGIGMFIWSGFAAVSLVPGHSDSEAYFASLIISHLAMLVILSVTIWRSDVVKGMFFFGSAIIGVAGLYCMIDSSIQYGSFRMGSVWIIVSGAVLLMMLCFIYLQLSRASNRT